MNPSIPTFNIGEGETSNSNNVDQQQPPLTHIPQIMQNSQIQSSTDTAMEGVENVTNTNNNTSNQNNQINRYSIEHPQGKSLIQNFDLIID